MLHEFGVSLCLVGHSERRQHLGETDDMVAKKAAALQKQGIVPVICVGETLAEKKKNATAKIIRAQVQAAIADIKPDGKIAPIFAYEPVWAIGSHHPCNPQDARAVHDLIRGILTKQWGARWSDQIRIIYGGSVDPRDVIDYMTTTGIDGALVGHASLDPRSFGLLCRAAVPA
jgi:triosephosphate isomerase